ncbi:hypothetical protein ACIPM5_25645 [Streptomyces microflavus]|uniref:hypothetical protein n=1 Tax=Streptomyces TaxID=1883 RepID=UPI00131C8BB8|nr:MULTISPECIES: hypothetical protein [Streptomyces]MBK3583216.1 hypothetical protein [Streptomyces sp. MBT57]QQZ56265.1 hypothetical protein IFE09_23655 [Streptomyces microflavus]WTF71627.1 hypothetical protein OH770_24765 [Streptomyces microflavus]
MASPMTLCFLVFKYDEPRRSGLIADWTSFEDVGKSFNGEVLTAAEYQRVEDSYISAVGSLADAVQADRFELRNLALNEPPPTWLGAAYEGRSVDRRTALRLLRRMLRHGLISCTLESGDALRVTVETDFYVSVEIQPDAVEYLEEVRRLGLNLAAVDCGEEGRDETAAISRPADGQFWEEVARSIGLSRGATVILERWAEGSCGYLWHPVFDGNLSVIAGSVRPNSLVTAYFETNVQWVSRRNLLPAIESAVMAEEFPVVIFSRSTGGVAPEILVCKEGVGPPTEAEVPPGDDFGFFLWPDDDSASLQAVVPGDGDRSAQ